MVKNGEFTSSGSPIGRLKYVWPTLVKECKKEFGFVQFNEKFYEQLAASDVNNPDGFIPIFTFEM